MLLPRCPYEGKHPLKSACYTLNAPCDYQNKTLACDDDVEFREHTDLCGKQPFLNKNKEIIGTREGLRI